MAAFGEELLAGFFDDDAPAKKPVAEAAAIPVTPAAAVAAPAPVAPVAPVVAVVPVVADAVSTPLRNASDVVEPMVVVPAKLEEVTELPVAVVEEAHSDAVSVAENEILELAASEPVAAEVAAVAAETPVVAPVAAALATEPVVKDTSEEEDLIEGVVNALIEDDGEGEL